MSASIYSSSHDMIDCYIKRMLCGLLEVEDINSNDLLNDLGITSSMATHISVDLMNTFGVELSIESIINQSNVTSLTWSVLKEVGLGVDYDIEFCQDDNIEYWYDTLSEYDFSNKYIEIKNINNSVKKINCGVKRELITIDKLTDILLNITQSITGHTDHKSILFVVTIPDISCDDVGVREVYIPVEYICNKSSDNLNKQIYGSLLRSYMSTKDAINIINNDSSLNSDIYACDFVVNLCGFNNFIESRYGFVDLNGSSDVICLNHYDDFVEDDVPEIINKIELSFINDHV